jgi:hypothetical protein
LQRCPPGLNSKRGEDLLQPGDVGLGLLEVVTDGLLKVRAGGGAGHLGKGLEQLALGAVDVLELRDEDLAEVIKFE